MPVSPIDEALRRHAATAPARIALVTDPGSATGTLNAAQLERETARSAKQIIEAAARASGPVAVEVEAARDRPRLLTLIAALRTTLPVLAVDPMAQESERQAVRAEVRRAGLRILRALPEENRFAVSETPDRPRSPLPPEEALLLASSGTSGRPKLIVDEHLRRTAPPAQARVTSRLNWSPQQVQLVIGRLHHAAPLTFFLYGLLDGNTLVVPARYAPSIAVELIETLGVHWMQATPFQLQRMAAWLDGHPAELGSLRGVLHMSAPCPVQVKRSWIERIGPERVFEIYGATEGIGLTVARGDEWLARPGTVGRGFLTQVRILDEAMRSLPAGADGLVFLRNRTHVTPGYLRATAGLQVSPDGFLSVGDHGRLDTDRYLYLAPRRVDMINVGGENVYPTEIEEVLVRCPGVADAGVVGIPDDRLGSRPLAAVARWPAAAVSEREVMEFCGRHLPGFKLPKEIVFVGEVPHTRSGKVDRTRLAELAPLHTPNTVAPLHTPNTDRGGL